MSDATEAWQKWYGENIDLLHQLDGRERDETIFAAGQVAALEDAAEAYSVVYHKASAEAMVEVYDFLRTRAAELSKEQHDQPDA